MRYLSVARSTALTVTEQIEAVFTNTVLYELAAAVPMRQPVGRPALNPGWLLLGYGVLARVFRSGARTEAELRQPAHWDLIRSCAAAMAQQRPDLSIAAPGLRPPDWHAWKHARNKHFSDPKTLAALQDRFTELAVEQARSIGLLDPAGPGSLCHPDRSRTVYGDGTVVRPLYRPPAASRTLDAATGVTTVTYLDGAGQPIDRPAHRFDPDAEDYHGHTGPVHGQNFVALYARGDGPHQRVVLGVDRVSGPGHEADTAVEAIQRLHAVAGTGIQAIVYDGAMRGVHIDALMTGCGLVVINKVHASGLNAARKGKTAKPRWFTLGTWEHDTPAGACTHQLAAVDGAVSEIGLDESGKPVVLARLDRKQVKRPRRSTGRYHFNVAYDIACDAGSFTAWVTPHALAGEDDHRRADAVRVIAEGEDDFTRLYGLRNDAESFNSQLKRTLLVDRAMSLGAQRQLLDVLCYAIVHNAATAYRLRAKATEARPARLRAA
jgi:hypothetical protein